MLYNFSNVIKNHTIITALLAGVACIFRYRIETLLLVSVFLYRETTDPMFFKVQRGEIEEAEWLNAIQEIKDTYKR